MAKTDFVWRWTAHTPWHHTAEVEHCSIEVKKPRRRALRDQPWSIVVFGDAFYGDALAGHHTDLEDAKRAAERLGRLRIARMAKAVGL